MAELASALCRRIAIALGASAALSLLCLAALPGSAAETGAAPAAKTYALPLGVVLTPQIRRFSYGVSALAYSADGRLLAAGDGNSVKLFDAARGILLRVLEVGHNVTAIAFAPDGKSLAEGGVFASEYADQPTGYGAIWDCATGKKRAEIELGDYGTPAVVSLAFAPQGKSLLVVASDGPARLFNSANGKRVRSFGSDKEAALAAALTPDGAIVATAGTDETTRLWTLDNGRPVRSFHAPAQAIAISPDGKRLAAHAGSGAVTLFDLATGKALHRLEASAEAGGKSDAAETGAVAFSRDGRLIVAANGAKRIQIWDASTGKALRTLASSALQERQMAPWPGESLAFALAPEEATIAVESSAGVAFLDAAGGPAPHPDMARGSSIAAVCFAPNSQSVVAWSADGAIRRWDMVHGRLTSYADTGVALPPQSSAAASSVRISPDAKTALTDTLVQGDTGQKPSWRYTLWDNAAGRALRVFPDDAMQPGPMDISPDGHLLALGFAAEADAPDAKHQIRLFDASSGEKLKTFEPVDDEFHTLRFAPDGRAIVSATLSGDVLRVWDVASGKPSMTGKAAGTGDFDQVETLKFRPDGKSIYAFADFESEQRDALRGALLQKFKAATDGWGLDVSGDGRWIAVGGSTPTLLSTATGKPAHPMPWTSDPVSTAAFSPDGRRIVVGDESGALTLYDVGSGNKLASFYARGADWAVLAPNGEFASSGDPGAFVSLIRGLDVLPLDDFRRLNVRNDLADALAGKP